MRFSSILTIFAVAVIVISLPATIYLTNKQQSQTTQASNSQNFFEPPWISLSRVADPMNPTIQTYSIDTGNTNWYTVYFAVDIPPINNFNSKRMIDEELTSGAIQKVFEGSNNQEFTFVPSASGKLFVMVYQLGNYIGEFQSGDAVCSWDGHLYIYERDRQNIISETLNLEEDKPGIWKTFSNCQNSGAVDIYTSN